MALSSGSDSAIIPLIFITTIIQERFCESTELHRHRNLIIRAIACELRLRVRVGRVTA